MLRNAFDLLADGGGQPAAGTSKTKKKNKKKGPGAVISDAITEQQPTAAPAPEPQPVQSAKDAGQALEAAAVAAGPGELGSLAAEWAEQVRAHTASKLCRAACSCRGHPLTPPCLLCRLQLIRGDEVFTDGKDLVEFRQASLLGAGCWAIPRAGMPSFPSTRHCLLRASPPRAALSHAARQHGEAA